MLKWILAAIAAVFIAAFVIWQRGAVKTQYVNGLAAYEHIPGHQYILERDCYIFKLKDRNTDLPLIGDHALVPALPGQVDAKFVGAGLPGVRILDVAHVGDRVRVVSVRRDAGRSEVRITFEILFLDEARRKYPRLDAYFILDHSPEAEGKAPAFLPTYAVEAVMH